MATDEKQSYAVGLGDVVVDRARDATLVEHSLTVREAFRLYRPAIGWSFLFSLGAIMASFDVGSHQSRIWTESITLAGRYSAPTSWNSHRHPYFPERFWYSIRWLLSRTSEVAIRVQSRRACGSGSGSFGVGIPLKRIGRRWTLGICCCISMIAVAIQFSAQNKARILVAELINGVVLGAYPVIAPTYISETTPVVLRGIGAAFGK